MTASRLINPLSNTNCSLHEQHKVTKTKSRQSQVSRGRRGVLAGGWEQALGQEHTAGTGRAHTAASLARQGEVGEGKHHSKGPAQEPGP